MPSCHTELHPLNNVYGMKRRECPVCGGYYYEKMEETVILDAFNGGRDGAE